MNRKLAFKSSGFKLRFLTCIMVISLLSGCATIPREVEELESPPSVGAFAPTKEVKSLISFRKDVEDLRADKKEVRSLISFRKDVEGLRADIKDLRKDLRKSDLTSKINITLLGDRLKTFGCGCLTGVVISGLTVFFTGLSTASN